MSEKTPSAKAVAACMVNHAIAIGSPVNPLALQHLLYLAQVEHCRELGRPLFSDPILAKECGPECREVWRRYCLWGAMRIRERQDVADAIPGESMRIVLQALIEHGRKNPWELAELTRDARGPWAAAYAGAGCPPAAMEGSYICDFVTKGAVRAEDFAPSKMRGSCLGCDNMGCDLFGFGAWCAIRTDADYQPLAAGWDRSCPEWSCTGAQERVDTQEAECPWCGHGSGTPGEDHVDEGFMDCEACGKRVRWERESDGTYRTRKIAKPRSWEGEFKVLCVYTYDDGEVAKFGMWATDSYDEALKAWAEFTLADGKSPVRNGTKHYAIEER